MNPVTQNPMASAMTKGVAQMQATARADIVELT